MAYTFKITRINKLSKARVQILDGELLEGVVTTDSAAKLVHDGRSIPVRIRGVVSGPAKGIFDNTLSLTVDLRQGAMKVAAVGDVLVGT